MQVDESVGKHAGKCQRPVPLLGGSWKADGSYEPLAFENSLFNTEEAVFFSPIFMVILTRWLLAAASRW